MPKSPFAPCLRAGRKFPSHSDWIPEDKHRVHLAKSGSGQDQHGSGQYDRQNAKEQDSPEQRVFEDVEVVVHRGVSKSIPMSPQKLKWFGSFLNLVDSLK